MWNNKSFMKSIVRGTYKLLVVGLAFFTAVAIWYLNVGTGWAEGYRGYTTLGLTGLMYSVIYCFFAKMYGAFRVGQYRLTELWLFNVISYGIANLALFIETIVWFHHLDKIFPAIWIMCMVGQVLIAACIIALFSRLYYMFDEPRKIVIVYGSDAYVSLVEKMNAKNNLYKVLECIPDTEPIGNIVEAIDKSDDLYLYDVNSTVKSECVLYCAKYEKNIYMTQDVSGWLMKEYGVSNTFDTPLIRTKHDNVRWYYPYVKRALDILVSTAGLIILSPVMLITAAAIKLYDHGPVLYKQIRLTKGHKEFYIYKFRSMITDAEKLGEARLAEQNDSRITPVGRVIRAARIDELPQLINILKGDMTIVGPRPERPEIEEQYLEYYPEFGMRLQVKAGLTGYAQVFGKYNTTPEDKLKMDILYIGQRSLLLDIKIIMYTFKILFVSESTEGIAEGHTTAMSDEVSNTGGERDTNEHWFR